VFVSIVPNLSSIGFDVFYRANRYSVQTIADARHNLVYRPFMLDCLWEDCTLIDLIENRPTTTKVENVYHQFTSEVFNWHNEYEPKREDAVKKYLATVTLQDLPNHPRRNIPPVGPAYFLEQLFMIYEDQRDSRPTETLLLTYARMLNGDNQALLEDLKNYRNDLIKVDRVKALLELPVEWRLGDV
jgi:hypothetical protein